uniref:Putative secreted protein n=1 Tax=Anopheles darlingi TaxID=43151 RepID=A0A2M4D502_ANODA
MMVMMVLMVMSVMMAMMMRTVLSRVRSHLAQARIAVVGGKVQRQQLQIVVRWDGRELMKPFLARTLRRDVGATRRRHVTRRW